jgi:hypothetical protein
VDVKGEGVVHGELGAAVDDLDPEALARLVGEAADPPVELLHAGPEVAVEPHPISAGDHDESQVGAARVRPRVVPGAR